jgi:hypothetical protein
VFLLPNYVIDGCDAVILTEFHRKETKTNFGGCLCKKNNQTPMTGQDREISDTQG